MHGTDATLSASRIWTTLASNATLIFIVSCVGCSAESPNLDAGLGIAGSQGPVGIAGGAAGQIGATAGVGGTISSGIAGQGAGAAGRAGGTAIAGTGGPTGVAGSFGASGSGVAGGSAGIGGAAGLGGMSGGGGSTGTAGAAGGSAGAGGSTSSAAGCVVAPIPADMRSKYQNMNDPYYTKYASANEVIVGTGPEVSDEAVVRYCRLLGEMTSNDAVRKAVLADKMWFTMIDEKEQLSSLPQIDKAYGSSLDQRARGLGGLTPTICAEDSIMCMPGDRWKGDCICPHEAGHTLYSSGIAKVPELSKRLTAITQAARSRLANAYVWMDGNESGMMSWGVQAWYDCAINGTNGAYHSDINTRAELQKELPEFYQFLSELLPTDNKYEDCYAN